VRKIITVDGDVLLNMPDSFEPEVTGDVVDFEVRDAVATIRFNRPDRLNAASVELLYTVTKHLYEVEARDDVGAVVITGAGEAFCSGFDLSEIPLDAGQQAVHEHFRRAALYWHDMIPAIVRLNKPVIAAVNGRAIGGGLGTTLACDMAFAGHSATFTPAFMAFGVGPDSTTTYHLPRIMGLRKAMEWIYTNETVDAEQAAAWDVVNRVLDDGDLLDAAYDVAEQLAAGPTKLYARTKHNMHMSFTESLETQTEWERQGVLEGTYMDHFWESTRAFQETGDPNTAAVSLPERSRSN
jgi:2-(1,2-epoxy-1,2-dihydrophenyl)acetyl-CoA isomerase